MPGYRPYVDRPDDAWKSDCPESVSGHGSFDAAGKCPFCRLKVGPVAPMPEGFDRSTLSTEYDYFWGNDDPPAARDVSLSPLRVRRNWEK